jgi:hypothetical protein
MWQVRNEDNLTIVGYVIAVNGNGVKLPGRIIDSDMHDVARFLNRLLGLPPNIQNKYAVILYADNII